VAGLALLVFGVSLIVNGDGALRLIATLNRWVSMRAATKPLEIVRDTQPLVQRYRYWFAAIFIVGGGFALYGLLLQFNAAAMIRIMGLMGWPGDVSYLLVDSLRMLLIVGNALAVVAGILLALFPGQVAELEARVGGWVSVRKATRGTDDMKVKLDPLVAICPRAIGVTVILIGLALIGTFGLMAQRVW